LAASKPPESPPSSAGSITNNPHHSATFQPSNQSIINPKNHPSSSPVHPPLDLESKVSQTRTKTSSNISSRSGEGTKEGKKNVSTPTSTHPIAEQRKPTGQQGEGNVKLIPSSSENRSNGYERKGKDGRKEGRKNRKLKTS
jgi:hypothetical protein